MDLHRGRSGLFLGVNTQYDRRKVYLSDKDRSTHLQIIGATGTGKSKMMEWMIREDILNRRGLCLIDPHASLYHDLIRWMATKRLERKVILFDPGEEGWVFAFNPLHKTHVDLSFQMDSMVQACAKVWGDADLDQTPLLKRCLRNIFYVLAEQGLTLVEALHLINESDSAIRQALTQKIADDYTRSQWQSYNQMSPREFREVFGSTQNRLIEFLGSERMRRILGQSQNTIDFRKIMDEGYIVLVNLSWGGTVSPQNARMLGTLLINDLFTAARGRPAGSRPFYLYIDEFAEFANEDTAQILDQCRKWGLHLTIAHQHLEQLKRVDEKVYYSVLTNAKTKLVFGGLTPDDAEVLAKQIFMGEFDIDEVKHILKSRKIMDYREETRTVTSRSHASGSSWSESSGESSSSGYGSSRGEGEASMLNPSQIDPAVTTSTSWGENSFWSGGSSSSASFGSSEMDSYGESTVPFLVPVFGEEVSSVQFRSLEEQLYRAVSLMINQPTRYGLLKIPNQKVMAIRAPEVTPGYARKERVEDYQQRCFAVSEFIKPRELAEQEIQERQIFLQEQVRARFQEPEGLASPPPKIPVHPPKASKTATKSLRKKGSPPPKLPQ